MKEKEWLLIDSNKRVLAEYDTYGEAMEVASMLEYYGLRCDIQKNKKENV